MLKTRLPLAHNSGRTAAAVYPPGGVPVCDGLAASLYIITLRLSVRPDVPVFLKKYPADFSETLHESSVW